MGWWTDPVGSKRPAKATTGRGGKAKIEKCGLCKQSFHKCKCNESPRTRSKVKATVDRPPKKDGTPGKRTKTINAPYETDGRGFDWCATCGMRYHTSRGKCSNVKCSTNR
jgi:hypothetical protein